MSETTIDRLAAENQRLQTELAALGRRLDEKEAALHGEDRAFQDMAETLADIVFTASPDGSWDYLNGRWRDVTGLSADAALGNGWTTALHPGDLERVPRELREAVASATPFESHFRLHTAEGIDRQFMARAHPLRDNAARVIRWVGTVTDVDDLLSAHDALDQASRQRIEFVRKLTHDLRNLAAPIQYAIPILRQPNADAAQTQRAVEIIDRQLREMRAFLDNLQNSNERSGQA